MMLKKTIGEMTELDNPSPELVKYRLSTKKVMDKLVEKERLREDIKMVTKFLNELKQKLSELERGKR
jgi:hypothetical protein